MDPFTEYSHAIVALALWPVVMIVLSFVAVGGKTAENTTASGNPHVDYASGVYRRGRAQANALEMSGPFIGATLAAILAGADPFWVNTLASVFLVSRIVMAVIHIATTIQPLRSVAWMVGLICVVSLVVMAVRAALV